MALPIIIQDRFVGSQLPSFDAQVIHRGSELVVKGTGESLAEAFEQAAVALASLVCDPDRVTGTHRVEVMCHSAQRELLLVDWLNELIHAMRRDELVFGRFEVRLENGFLCGTAWGERLDQGWHRPLMTPAGAARHGIEIEKNHEGRWIAQCAIEL